jgi:hypothetical protein
MELYILAMSIYIGGCSGLIVAYVIELMQP